MVRVVFNPSYTDGYKYDVNDQYVIPSGATNGAENEYSYTNQARTLMKVRVNLRAILGSDYTKSELICIRLTDVKAINETGKTLIDETSPGWITSNIVLSGPNFVGGPKAEYKMGQATNFNPNEETTYAVRWHRGNLVTDRFYFTYNSNQQAGTGKLQELFNNHILPLNTNLTELRKGGIRWNSYPIGPTPARETLPSLDNKVFII